MLSLSIYWTGCNSCSCEITTSQVSTIIDGGVEWIYDLPRFSFVNFNGARGLDSTEYMTHPFKLA